MTDNEVKVESPGAEPANRRPVRRAKRTAVVAVVAIAGVALLFWLLKPGSRAGRPVPAPRTEVTEQTTNQQNAASNEPTITIAPAMMQRAGIKVEVRSEEHT